jgi:hypothetical protein
VQCVHKLTNALLPSSCVAVCCIVLLKAANGWALTKFQDQVPVLLFRAIVAAVLRRQFLFALVGTATGWHWAGSFSAAPKIFTSWVTQSSRGW